MRFNKQETARPTIKADRDRKAERRQQFERRNSHSEDCFGSLREGKRDERRQGMSLRRLILES